MLSLALSVWIFHDATEDARHFGTVGKIDAACQSAAAES